MKQCLCIHVCVEGVMGKETSEKLSWFKILSNVLDPCCLHIHAWQSAAKKYKLIRILICFSHINWQEFSFVLIIFSTIFRLPRTRYLNNFPLSIDYFSLQNKLNLCDGITVCCSHSWKVQGQTHIRQSQKHQLFSHRGCTPWNTLFSGVWPNSLLCPILAHRR